MLLFTTFADRVFKDLTCNLGAVAWEKIGVSTVRRKKEVSMPAVRATALLLLLAASVAQADPQTVLALQAANVPLSITQVKRLSASSGNALVVAVGELAKRSPSNAVAITSAVIPVHPELAGELVTSLVTAVPDQLSEILEAAIAVSPDQAAELATLVSTLLPTAAGESSPGFDRGTGVPSTGNAGTGSTPSTASPS